MEQKTAKFHGIGFVIGPCLIPHIQSWWYVSNRVAVINVAIPNPEGRFTEYRVVNAYGLTMENLMNNPAVRDRFYEERISAATATSQFQVFVCGDFNSKLGHNTPKDEEAVLSAVLVPMAKAYATAMVKH